MYISIESTKTIEFYTLIQKWRVKRQEIIYLTLNIAGNDVLQGYSMASTDYGIISIRNM